MPPGTAPVLATNRECPDRYEYFIYTVVLCFPEALLSLGRLYSLNEIPCLTHAV